METPLDSALASFFVATAATLQALLASHLARPLLKNTIFLAREGDVSRFLLRAGPVACLLSATIAIPAIYIIGQVTPDHAVTLWLFWWFGDTLGVLLFTPIILASPIADSILPKNGNRVILPLLITTILLLSGNLALNAIEESQAMEKADNLMEDSYESGFYLLPYSLIPLRGVEQFFTASTNVTEEEYNVFSSYIARQPWVHSIDWAPRIRHRERYTLEVSLRQRGVIESGLFDIDAQGNQVPSDIREEYFPVTLTEPLTASSKIIGLDHAFEAPRRDAMERARDSGKITVTPMLPLLRTTQRAILAFTPVYGAGFEVDQASIWQRREALRGFVVGVFDIRQIFTALDRSATAHQLLYRVTDITSEDSQQVLWSTLPEDTSPQWRRTVDFADRIWQLEMQFATPIWQPGASLTSRFYLGFSVLAAFLITFATLSAAGRTAATTLKVFDRTIELAHELDARREAEREIQRLNLDLERKVEDRTLALQELHFKEEQLRAIVENLPYGLVTIDARGMVYSANPAMEQVLGFKPTELIGKNISLIMPEPDRSRHNEYLAHYVDEKDGPVVNTGREVHGQHKDGRLIPLELAITEYRAYGERFFIGSIWDISERKHFIEELTRARLDAEQANRAKSSFLAVMSHEIRTPMNGVIGLVDVLAHSRLSDYQTELVTTIRESATTLLDIIDDILDFSKIDAGRMTIEHNPVCVASLIEGLCSSLQPDAASKGVALSLFISPEIPLQILSDSVRLRQSLGNLIGNAIKFSAKQSRRKGIVSVRVTLSESDPQRLIFEVVDNGIGMTQTTMDQLFKPFTQAEASTTRRFGGTGLGLAITQRLVKLMDGDITVSSRPGTGSRFTISLPFKPAVQQPAQAKPELSGIRCLVIESADINIADLRAYLEDAGAEVVLAADALTAVQLEAGLASPVVAIQDAGQQRPAVDPALAEIDRLHHLQLTRGRRQRARLESTNVVTLDYPLVRRQALLHAVALAAGRAAPKHFHAPPLPELTVDAAPPPDIEEARAQGRLILVAEDDTLNQRVILQQLALLGYAAEIAGNGTDALRLWRKDSYALLLTDLQMPDMDGYTLAKTIRHEEAMDHRIPILALTANALREEADQTRAVGMDEYLTKPLQLRQLREVLEKWLPKRENVPSTKHLPSSDSSGPSVDVTVLHDMIGDDPETVSGLLSDYLESLQHLAHELRSAYKQNDIRQVSAITHKLKSSSRVVGALALGDLCAKIELAAKSENRCTIDESMPQFEAAFTAVDAEIRKLLEVA